MAEMLLINPRKRTARKARKTTHTAKRKVHARRKNPIAAIRRKRAHPMHTARKSAARRRRNPIAMRGMMGGYMGAIREALMGGAGAVAMEVVFGQVNKFLPASLQKTPGAIGAGDAVKAIMTVFIGQALNGATKGFSKKAAQASLTIQAHDIIKSFVPASLPLGYASPAMIAQGTNRVGPIRKGVNAYTGGTALLSAYNKPGAANPLLSGARSREGVSTMY